MAPVNGRAGSFQNFLNDTRTPNLACASPIRGNLLAKRALGQEADPAVMAGNTANRAGQAPRSSSQALEAALRDAIGGGQRARFEICTARKLLVLGGTSCECAPHLATRQRARAATCLVACNSASLFYLPRALALAIAFSLSLPLPLPLQPGLATVSASSGANSPL